MKRLLLFLGALAAGAALFGFLIAGVGWHEVWESLSALSLLHVLLVLFLTFLFLLANIWRWHFVLKTQGCALSFFEASKVYFAGFPLFFFVPMFPFANEIFRATWLKEKHQIDLPKGTASVIIDRILEVTSNLFLVFIAGIIFLLFGDSISYSSKMIAVIGFIVLWPALLLFLYIRLFQKKSIVRLLWKSNGSVHEAEKEVFRFFQVRNPAFWQGMVLASAESVVGVVRAWAIIVFFGKGFALLPGITAHGFYYLTLFMPIPAALGSHEVLQVAAFSSFGLESGTGAAFALVVRAAEMLFALVGLLFLLQFTLHVIKDTIFHRGDKLTKMIRHG